MNRSRGATGCPGGEISVQINEGNTSIVESRKMK